MKQKIRKVIIDICHELFDTEVNPELTIPDEQHGDVTTNVAMQLAGKLQKNPRDIAQTLATELVKLSEIESTEVAGPGFINMRLTDEALIQAVSSKELKSLSGQKVLVEYSDPNPFKPLHAGHLYTTLVGDVLARLIENAGAETIRLNYGGDVGRHVGISMWAIMKRLGDHPIEALAGIPEDERPMWMGECYVEGTTAFEDDAEAKTAILAVNKRVYQVHADNDHESDFAQVYWSLRESSYAFFKKLYSELQVTSFDRFIPESEVTPLGFRTVQAQKENSVFTESEGAVVFVGEPYGLHTRVFINNEGLPTYEAKDVGLSLTKWNEYHPDRSIIITANEQKQYMEVVIKAIEQFEPGAANTTQHLTHGFVKLSGGVKMSSRKGNILSAFDVLEAARQAGKESGQADNEEVVLASVKYAMLKNRIGGDIEYDPKESIATEGNSGPYLQYAHARARSILRKSELVGTKLETNANLEKSERTLLRKIGEYTDVVELATRELAPHHICTYLYELAQTFNRFYEQTKVIGSEQESFRVQLVTEYADRLQSGLRLLGIHAPEQM
jgi:arginyl-tRNA synthetase